jgi:stage V sporulation protein S
VLFLAGGWSWESVLIEVLKVSSKSNPNSVAGALAGVVRSHGTVEIQVVGAGALNQAIKAVAIARGYMATSGQDLTCRPTFADIEIDGESRTAIRLQVETSAPRTNAPVPGAGAPVAKAAPVAPAAPAAPAVAPSPPRPTAT